MEKHEEFLAVGSKFGAYRILSLLSYDRTGTVYLADSGSGSARVAIRIVNPICEQTDKVFKANLLDDIERMMSTQQESLCAFYQVGRDRETHYAFVIMEYAEGGTLKDKLRERGRFSVEEAIELVKKLVPALLTAEVCQVVYRDISSDSLIFDGNGTLKLADFRLSDEPESTSALYRAPECMGEANNISSPARVYALGVMLWELLVGALPTPEYAKDGLLPDIRSSRPDIPEEIAELIKRMTRANPDERLQSLQRTLIELKQAATVSRTQRQQFSARIKMSRAMLDDIVAQTRNMSPVSAGKTVPNRMILRKPLRHSRNSGQKAERTFSRMPPLNRPQPQPAPITTQQQQQVVVQKPLWLYVTVGGLAVAVVLILLFSVVFYKMTFSMIRQGQQGQQRQVAVQPSDSPSKPEPAPTAKPKPKPVVVQEKPESKKPVQEKKPVRTLQQPKIVVAEKFQEVIAPELAKYALYLERAEKGEKSDAEKAIVDAVNAARLIDPDMRAYDFNGHSVAPNPRPLSPGQLEVLRLGKTFLILELLRQECPALHQKYELEKLKYVTALPAPRDLSLKETVALLSKAAERDVARTFRKFGIRSGLE